MPVVVDAEMQKRYRDIGQAILMKDHGRSTKVGAERFMGRIQKWVAEKDFGFIRMDGSDGDVYCHGGNLSTELQEVREKEGLLVAVMKTSCVMRATS